MTLTEINMEEVKASMDAALEALQKELRDLNHQVSSGFCSNISLKANTEVIIIRFGQTLNLPTKSIRLTIQSAISLKDRVSQSLATLMVLAPPLKP
jgi:hypothetical protein